MDETVKPEQTPGPERKPDEIKLAMTIGKTPKPDGTADFGLRVSNPDQTSHFPFSANPFANPVPDEPEPIQPEPEPVQPKPFHETLNDAFRITGENMLAIARELDLLRATVKQVLEEKSQLVDLVTRLSDQVKALTALQDSDHAAIEVLLMSQPKARDVN